MNHLKLVFTSGVVLAVLAAVVACDGKCECEDACTDSSTTDSDADTDSDTDSDTDDDTDNDTDSDSDSDTDTGLPDAGLILPDCDDCDAVGTSLEHMRCAVELCDDEVFTDQEYDSPSNAPIEGTFEAITRYGDDTNHLAPIENESYAVMASGIVMGTDHDVQLNPSGGAGDPFSNDGQITRDVMEWSVRLKAPPNARGIQISYVFFSAEYDEFVGSTYNDRFYIILEALSTNGGFKTVINFAECRDPDNYYDQICSADLEAIGACVEGDKLCYIAVNTAFSECCWYQDCPYGYWTTDISGTGFSCADEMIDETIGGVPNMDMGKNYGSSSGWLVTEWPVDPNEDVIITFHVHDTVDARLDSAVIIDKVVFTASPADPGTGSV